MDILSVKEISANLTVDADIQIFDTLESTNTTAKELALNGALNGTAIIADGLTAARGRCGRSFYAPKSAGIYMSVILRPESDIANSPELITISAAVAVCNAIENVCKKSPKVKWINDIFIGGKKICGILAEAVTNNIGDLQAIILGIGINFVKVDVPNELREIVGAVFENEPTTTRNHLIAEVLNNLLTPRDWDETLEIYKNRLFMLNKDVRVETAEPYVATAIDVDERGRLIVQKSNGETHILDSGEISIKL